MTPQEVLEKNRSFGNVTCSNKDITEYVRFNFLCSTSEIVDNLNISRSRLMRRRDDIDGVEMKSLGSGNGTFVWYSTELREKGVEMGMDISD